MGLAKAFRRVRNSFFSLYVWQRSMHCRGDIGEQALHTSSRDFKIEDKSRLFSVLSGGETKSRTTNLPIQFLQNGLVDVDVKAFSSRIVD